MDFLQYVIGEYKNGRLDKAQVLALLREFRANGQEAAGRSHPLLQRDASDAAQRRFSSTFNGEEPFLADHLVAGARMLPAAAYLEMARAALEQAGVGAAGEWRLQDVVWVQPLVVDGAPVTVHIALTPELADTVAFEIYSERDGARVVHARGAAAPTAPTAVPPWDLVALRARCEQRFDVDRCYAAFAARGIDYGPSHRGLTEVAVGRLMDGAMFALAPLRLPAANERYGLAPGLLDSALQASVGVLLAEDAAAPMGLPFALGALQLLRGCPAEPVAVVRVMGQQLDIDLCDENGAVCVRVQGFRTRPAQLKEIVSSERPAFVASDATDEMELLLLAPVFEAAPLPAAVPVPAQRQLLFVCAAERYAAYQAALSAQAMQCDWLLHGAEGRSAAQRYSEATAALFDTVQGVLQSKPTEAVLLQVVVEEDGTPWAGLAGLLKSAAQENPQLIVQWLGVAATAPVATVLAQVQAEAGQRSEPVVRYRDGERQRETLTPLPAPVPAPVFRADGVYLITGGLGGLGRQFAAAAAAAGAAVVLSGRSALDAAGEAVLAALRAQGARAVDYQRADVADRAAVEALIRGIESRHGGLHGIVHAAGLLRDGFLLKKNRAELAAVLAPKVAGTLHLDAATRYLQLDFLVLCSSLAGALGNVGQGDYAAANAFMDAFAAQRNAQVAAGERSGRTVSINWPLWADGGMQVDAAQREQLRRRGLRELSNAAGVVALAQALATGRDQVVLLAGVASQLAQLPLTQLLSGTVAPAAQVAVETEEADPQLREQALRHFRQLLGQTLKLAPHQLEADAEFEQYGIDSIKVMQLNGALEQQFGALPKTLFFEYQTLTELVDYFLRAHRDALQVALSGREDDRTMDTPSLFTAASTTVDAATNKIPLQPASVSAVPRLPADGPLDIAIIGVAGRYPQAPDLAVFWDNLREGRDCISEVPAERWDHSAYFDAEKGKPGKTYTKWGGFIDGVDHFDPQFFNISPREAEAMDPQERLFLQCAHAALEEAGYTRDTLGRRRRRFGLTGNVGVFVGVMYEEYQLYGAQAQVLGQPFALPGNPSSIANRVSYFCNFHGPSIALDTMCSSSLTALHLACQSLARGECEAAIAGGVNVSVHPNKYLGIGQTGFASSKGRCESFGAGGDGYVPGEGVGAVVLKPLADAVADGDHIHGVIKATAVNHGGRTNGYTVPNPNAQGAVIAQTLAEAGIDARSVSYVEAHGTGTALGDPIEIAGLMKAFAPHTQDTQFCAIGSVKSNIGHCESAAGIAGLTKVLLQMKHGTLVPSLHAQTLNPHLDLADSPFVVQRELAEWPRPVLNRDGIARELPRIAGLSSFGAGGANAHILIEEHVAEQVPFAATGPALILLSAKNEERLLEQARNLLRALEAGRFDAADLPRIAYTLQVGREAMESRLALVAGSLDELADKLTRVVAGEAGEDVHRGEVKRADSIALLAGDDDMQQTVGNWLAKGKHDKVLALWANGLSIDWNRLYGAQRPNRIALPTYPFAQKRYWKGIELERPVQSAAQVVTPAVTPVAMPLPRAAVALSALAAAPASMPVPSSQPVPPAPPVERMPAVSLETVQGELVASLAEALMMDEADIDLDKPFAEMGVDSIIGVEWVRALNRRYGVVVSATKVYEYPNIRQLAEFVHGTLADGAGAAAPSDAAPEEAVAPAPAHAAITMAKPQAIALAPLAQTGETAVAAAVVPVSPATAVGERPEIAPAATAVPQPIAPGVIEEALVVSLAEALYLEPAEVDVDTPFAELGLDSIIGVEWVRALNQRYGITLAATTVYEHPTIRALAGWLVQQLAERPPEPVAPAVAVLPAPAAPAAPVAPVPVAAIVPVAPVPPSAKPQPLNENVRNKVVEPEEAIAIVGIAGRYPGAQDLTAYWDNLTQGRNSVREIPAERWDVARYFDPRPGQRDKIYCKWLGALDDIDRFDPLFFGISPADAELMDPQQRLFLQEAYRAIEDAGIDPRALNERQCGVYLGLMGNEYGQLLHGRGLDAADTTGNSAAIAAARIAYHLNLKGPALSVDTACSSSLVATHLACQALRSGEIEMALTGGVSLYLTPGSYLGMCGAGMLSPAGQCKAMDNSADGFVPGEGVGVLVLKRLRDAQRDGDRIYATIVGSGINQDGKTNGITAPNVKSQVALERAVYARYGIDPDTISYVELHGTGTKLGDPIELEALATVFGERTQRRQFCALGSVKSNIGHTSAAAGVAGVQKVLLSLQHGELVPTLHYRTPNEHFDFANSPFYVNTERRAWRSEAGQPRRAAVSSFGFSGTNAHLVLEEYRGAAARPTAPGPVLLVLSAKNSERLREQARRLHGYLSAQVDVDLAAVAYTLQVGREALPHRLAFVADDAAAAQAVLAAFAATGEAAGAWSGRARPGAGGEALAAAWSLVGAARLAQLAERWVQGAAVAWSRLYETGTPMRLALPTYAFAEERYWLPTAAAATVAASTAVLHPLLHQNTSDFSEQRFTSTFTGAEPFLADHVVKGARMLPGTAYLEMARAALEQAGGPEGGAWQLNNVAWLQPLVVADAPVTVHIGLSPEPSGRVAFEIYSEDDEGAVIYAEGSALAATAPAVPAWDLAALRARCEQRFDVDRCYAAFAARGIDYGASHRGLTEVAVGRLMDGAMFALAPLRLPAVAAGYRLPPGLLDSALQVSVGLLLAGDAAAPMGLPFALGALQVLRDCPAEPVAVVRVAAARGMVRQLDIDLCDENGTVCVRLQGFSTRPAAGEPAAVAAVSPLNKSVSEADEEHEELLLVERTFEAAPLPATTPVPAQRLLLFVCAAERYAAYQAALSAQAMQCDWLLHGAEGRSAAQRYSEATAALFDTVQGVLQSKPTEAVLLQVVVEEDGTPWAGLAGLLKSAAQENPQLIVQWLGVAATAPVATVLAQVQAEAGQRSEPVVRYRDGERQRETLTPLPAPVPAPVFRADGVYLITGGLGGLGRQFAAAAAAAGAAVVLSGRSALDAAGEAVLAALRAQGARAVDYQRADVADRAAVEALIRGIESRHGGLHGIVHAAGLLRDGFLLKKNRAELAAVLAPKVAGTLHLDAATRYLQLDFLVLCSSLAGALGNVGQGDYAAANAFMDAFAAQRNAQVAAGERSGRTVSINWPLWADGGMQVDAAQREQLRRRGLRELSSAAGVVALAQALATGRDQVVVLAGVGSQLAQLPLTQLLSGAAAPATPAAVAAVETEPADPQLREQALRYFRQLLGQTLKLAPHQLEADAEFEQYGIDSIKVMQLNGALEQQFGALPKTLFFEYQTLTELVDYFLRAHRPALRAALQGGPQAAAPALPAMPAPRRMARRERWASAAQQPSQPSADGPLDIAIIGVAGRYPQAPDLETFWTNLREGRDCISEVPAERWDHSAYFDAEKGKPGKTYSKWGGFIDGVDCFDPRFFRISPREAMIMDPQERLFLQCVYATLEDAGYTRERLARLRGNGLEGNVGVFVGVMYEEYQLYGAQAQALGQPYALPGNPSSIANRVSYFCNFHGPSIALDTMCSSSLTALHLACQSLARGECEAAIAGGVNVSVHPNKYLALAQAQFASSRGRCESFGAGGDGYVPGEGVGAVLLKPLRQAIADGDRIDGVIKATAINHGGRTNGYTVPNPNAQSNVITRALAQAGVSPRAVSYVEAQGIGSALGDPIEIAGLVKAFAPHTRDTQFCAIGSVKSNIGHCESAGGIAGLTKVLLQMKHGALVPSLHAQTLNPHLDLANSPFVVQRELAEWPRPVLNRDGIARELPRIAGLSAFGAGGANAHVIVEEYIAPVSAATVAVTPQAPALVVLSARTEPQLRQRAEQLQLTVASRGDDIDLAGIAYTLQVGREPMAFRLALAVASAAELVDKLQRFLAGDAAIEECYHGELGADQGASALFGADEDLQQALEAWIAKGKYAKLLQAWTRGVAFDWERLYRGERPTRVSLPTYPFAQDRCWIGELAAQASADAPPAVPARANREAVPEALPAPVVASASVVASAPAVEAPAATASAPAGRVPPTVEALREILAETLAEALYLDADEIAVDTPFVEQGLDSIVGVQWVRALNHRFGVALPATKFYEYPNIRELAVGLHVYLADAEPVTIVPTVAEPTPAPAALSSLDVVEPQPIIEPAAPAPQSRAVPVAIAEAGRYRDDAIAVVGMSGRYPGADDLGGFWDNLQRGVSGVREIPPERWDIQQYFDPRPGEPGRMYCKWLGVLDGIDRFDPLFFGISPAEAELMDPQQRLFLQEAYRTIEDAGYDPRDFSNRKCGVYLGIMSNEYALMRSHSGLAEADLTGTSPAIGAARIAYHLNLKGPAVAVDTACSSSLTAVHLACQALRAGEVDTALAGGVMLYLSPHSYVGLCASGTLSPVGQCKAMDNDADGFVPGEGVGVVLLKRLRDAEAAGDRICGVIIGSGINQDGKTNGIIAPNIRSQIELEREVYQRYDIHPETIGYVEMHGTGTKLGDPIELGALATVFGERTERKQFCALGAVKSNIGHTASAAGIAGFHKALLSLQHEALVPTLHFHTPNEHFDFAASPFYVNTELREWHTDGGRAQRAAVSAFGFSGTNAHLVLEAYRPTAAPTAAPAGEPVLVVLSARTATQLQLSARRLHDRLLRQPALDLAAVAYTLQVGREAMERRLALVVASRDELLQRLAAFAERGEAAGAIAGQVKSRKEGFVDFAADEDARALLQVWLEKKKLKKIAGLWVQGMPIEWSRLYGDTLPARLSLPGYPFAEQRCWLSAAPAVATAAAPVADTAFDAGRYERLFDAVLNEELSVEAAVASARQTLNA